MFGVGLLLGIGLGCNSHCHHNRQYSNCRRSTCRYTECNSYSKCNYDSDNRCGHGRNCYDHRCNCRY